MACLGAHWALGRKTGGRSFPFGGRVCKCTRFLGRETAQWVVGNPHSSETCLWR